MRSRILKELRYVRPTTNPERLKQIEQGRREARDRDRALRDPDRRVHLDGAHRLGHRAAPAAPDDATPATRRTRRALVIAEMVRLVKEWDPLFFEKVGLGADRRPTTCRRRASRRPRGGGDCFAARVRRAAERPLVAAARRVAGRRRDRRRGRALGLRPRPPDEMSDDEALDRVMNPAREPLPPRRPERLVPLAADAGAAPRDLRVREAAEPHRRLAGPAPPHGAGVAAADDVRRHARSPTTSRRG